MIKKIVIALVFMASLGLSAQNGTISPYSFFGIGDIRASGTVENQMMGGIGMYADSIHVNLKNPAAYGELGMDVLNKVGTVVYTAGISRNNYRLKSYTEEESPSVTTLDYLSLGFSLGKGLGMGFGVMPYSSVGYNFLSEREVDGQTVTNNFNGDGGLNRVYYSIGYEIIENLSIGATVNFNYGTLNSERLQQADDVQFGAFDRRSSEIHGFDFNYALNYTPTIKEGYTLHASVRVNTQGNLVSENERKIGSFSNVNGVNIEEIEVDLYAQNLANTELKIPTTTTVGLGYGKDLKWFLGAEYSYQGLSSFENSFMGVDNVQYKDASSFALGGFYTPNYNSFNSYFNRITYRAGLRLDKTGMVVNDVDINNFGITFGLGLPLGRSFSNLNIGFEMGRRGTTKADLIEESYYKINLGLSLNDRWFRKRKVD
ncbi:membrane protein [Maribacter thermophilus]|uniref:membrane protein n=1 Tax=Maribacter thermophilus TaxID=1197874 RepID=UPI000640C92B|nr:membrane protein [Maribacter thermophilus]